MYCGCPYARRVGCPIADVMRTRVIVRRADGELVALGIEDEVGHVLVGGLACPVQQREDTDLYCEEDNVAGVAAAL